MYQEVIKKIKPELEKVINFLKREINKIQVGRPSISLIEDFKVNYFGQIFLLKQLASITLAQEGEIVIQPWDKSYLSAIEEAISRSNLNFGMSVKDDKIFLSLPPLTLEHRENLLKILSEKKENARETIRHWREEAWKEIQRLFREKEISEDDKYKAKDELQKIIDEYNEKVEELAERKKKEIEIV